MEEDPECLDLDFRSILTTKKSSLKYVNFSILPSNVFSWYLDKIVTLFCSQGLNVFSYSRSVLLIVSMKIGFCQFHQNDICIIELILCVFSKKSD